jgi:hypothetical protein
MEQRLRYCDNCKVYTPYCSYCMWPHNSNDCKCHPIPEPKGLYRKFAVTRADGSSKPGGKHENCYYFVLDLDHDKYAIPALIAYASVCWEEYPELADDIMAMVAKYYQK